MLFANPITGKASVFGRRLAGKSYGCCRSDSSFSSVKSVFVASEAHKNAASLRFEFPQDADARRRRSLFERSFVVVPDAVSEEQETSLVDEIEKSLKRLRYQRDHWDDAIHDYRETEIASWKDASNAQVMEMLRTKAFADGSTTKPMDRVHVLDLSINGHVKPHVDSVRFCGNIIAGLSLLSDSVMRLADELHPNDYVVYAVLPRRSLYVMRDDVRYQYTHAILNDGAPSIFSDRCITRQRRISIVMRNEPRVDAT